MIHWNKELPKINIDHDVYKPFIKNEWFRKNYMYFTYGLMIFLFVIASIVGGFRAGNLWIRILIFPFVYVIHESLHVLTVCRRGELYLNYFGGIYLWMTPDFELSKGRFWVYMTLPLLVLTGLTGIAGLFSSGEIREYFYYIAWLNSIIAGSDIINSVLILFKPARSIFYRGYYRPMSHGSPEKRVENKKKRDKNNV